MKMFIGCDHRGILLKDQLLPFLKERGYDLTDLTPPANADWAIDFPLVSQAVAKHVAAEPSLGLLICGSGIGVAIAANRFRGIRAANAHTSAEIIQAKEHNHINVLCLGADDLNETSAQTLITSWLEAKEDNAERRLRRMKQLDEYGS